MISVRSLRKKLDSCGPIKDKAPMLMRTNRIFREEMKTYVGIASLFGIVGLFVFSGWNTFLPITNFFSLIFSVLLGKLIHFMAGFLIGVVIVSVYLLISYSFRIRKWKKNTNLTEQANAAIKEQNKKESAVYQQKADLLSEQRKQLREKYKETLDVLNSYYSIDVIYPKYRNFVAVSSIYEYILSGRCQRLEGNGGAYDTFEYESRLDRIIVQLDDVIERLDEIRDNQYQLYIAVQDGIKQSHALQSKAINSINRLETSQELNNYYSEISAKNSEYFRVKSMYINTH